MFFVDTTIINVVYLALFYYYEVTQKYRYVGDSKSSKTSHLSPLIESVRVTWFCGSPFINPNFLIRQVVPMGLRGTTSLNSGRTGNFPMVQT